MGMAKRLMLEAQENRQWALETLAEANVLDRCDIHEEYSNASTNEVLEAYKLANLKISQGRAPFDQDERKKATDAIKAAYEEHEFIFACPSCERMMSKD